MSTHSVQELPWHEACIPACRRPLTSSGLLAADSAVSVASTSARCTRMHRSACVTRYATLKAGSVLPACMPCLTFLNLCVPECCLRCKLQYDGSCFHPSVL